MDTLAAPSLTTDHCSLGGRAYSALPCAGAPPPQRPLSYNMPRQPGVDIPYSCPAERVSPSHVPPILCIPRRGPPRPCPPPIRVTLSFPPQPPVGAGLVPAHLPYASPSTSPPQPPVGAGLVPALVLAPAPTSPSPPQPSARGNPRTCPPPIRVTLSVTPVTSGRGRPCTCSILPHKKGCTRGSRSNVERGPGGAMDKKVPYQTPRPTPLRKTDAVIRASKFPHFKCPTPIRQCHGRRKQLLDSSPDSYYITFIHAGSSILHLVPVQPNVGECDRELGS